MKVNKEEAEILLWWLDEAVQQRPMSDEDMQLKEKLETYLEDK